MAISKSIILKSSLEIPNAYIRIDSICGCKKSLQISVNSYVDKECFGSGKEYLEQNIYNFIPNVEDNSANFIKQGYDYLKTLDEYKDSIDLLD